MNVGDSERTIDLTPGATEGVLFDGMTADGSKVFFSSEEHLTGEDEQHTGADIFMWSQKGEEEGTTADPDLHRHRRRRQRRLLRSRCQHRARTLEHDRRRRKLRRRRDRRRRRRRLRQRHDLLPLPELLDGSEEPQDGVKNAPNLYVASPGQPPHFVATLESSLTGPSRLPRVTPSSAPSGRSPNRFIAVDNSGGPSNGDVYVVDTDTNAIYKYNSSHELMTSWGEHGKLTGFAN